MSSLLEWAGIASGPAGVLAGISGKGFFDRRVRRASAKHTEADAKKTEAEVPKIDAEAAKVIADTAIALVAPLREEINDLRTRLDTLEDENNTANTKLQIAFDYIVTLLRWIARHAPDKTPPATPTLLDL